MQAGVQECVEPVDQVRVQEMEAEIRRLRMRSRCLAPPSRGCGRCQAAGLGDADPAGVRPVPADLRVPAQLNREGCACSAGLVAGLMRELGLRAVQSRGYRRTTLPGDRPVDSPDLLERAFARTAARRASGWSVTSPTCAPVRAGCIWPP